MRQWCFHVSDVDIVSFIVFIYVVNLAGFFTYKHCMLLSIKRCELIGCGAQQNKYFYY